MVDLARQPVLGSFEFLDPPALADIDLRSEEINRLARIVVDRADVRLVPELRLVAAIVEQFDGNFVCVSNRVATIGRPERRYW